MSGVGLRALPETRGTGLNPEKALRVVSHLQFFERGGGQKELPVISVRGFQETRITAEASCSGLRGDAKCRLGFGSEGKRR